MQEKLKIIETLWKENLKLNNSKLLELASIFKIPIDEKRLEDYKILKFDIRSIGIYDEKNSTSYQSELTGHAELLSYHTLEDKFIEVVTTSPDYKLERTYDLNGNILIEKITILSSLDHSQIAFEREYTHSVSILPNKGQSFAIRYGLELDVTDDDYKKRVVQPLLTSIYKDNAEDAEVMIQTYTYAPNRHNYIDTYDTQDVYTYTSNDNIVYGINGLDIKAICRNFKGICIYNRSKGVKKYLPYGIKYDGDITNSEIKSLFVFKGALKCRTHNRLDIFKTNENITIRYRVRNFGEEEEKTFSYCLKTANNDYITIKEILKLIQFLINHFDDDFIRIVIKELLKYSDLLAEKLSQKEIITSELDVRLQKDLSLESIYEMVSSDKPYYFNLAEKQFKESTNIELLNEGYLLELKK